MLQTLVGRVVRLNVAVRHRAAFSIITPVSLRPYSKHILTVVVAVVVVQLATLRQSEKPT